MGALSSVRSLFFCYSLKLSQPGVSHNGPENRRQVAQSHKGVVDGGSQVIVPAQEVLEVQHKDSCVQAKRMLVLILQYINISLIKHSVSSEMFGQDYMYEIFSPRMP